MAFAYSVGLLHLLSTRLFLGPPYKNGVTAPRFRFVLIARRGAGEHNDKIYDRRNKYGPKVSLDERGVCRYLQKSKRIWSQTHCSIIITGGCGFGSRSANGIQYLQMPDSVLVCPLSLWKTRRFTWQYRSFSLPYDVFASSEIFRTRIENGICLRASISK